MEQTLSIIKPDATKRGLTEEILTLIKNSGLAVKQQKKMTLTRAQAEEFYAVHNTKPFFNSLCQFMTSGEVSVQVLEGENAVQQYRTLMGATNPKDADEGTIRALFAESMEANSVHGSDSVENATKEIAFFFGSSSSV